MRIGLTGGMGCGVTEAARCLQKKGIPVLSGDETGYRALKNAEVKATLTQHFNSTILEDNGEINRAELGRIVFADRDARQFLNEVIHPVMLKMLHEEVAEAETDRGIVVVDAALIFEWNLQAYFHKIIVVTAPLEFRISRTMARNGLAREEVLQRISAQMPVKEKAASADFIVENRGTIGELHHNIESVWAEITRSSS